MPSIATRIDPRYAGPALARANAQIGRAFATERSRAEVAADFHRLAREALSGLARARRRDAWCAHLMTATCRRHAMAVLELSALYRRCARETLAGEGALRRTAA